MARHIARPFVRSSACSLVALHALAATPLTGCVADVGDGVSGQPQHVFSRTTVVHGADGRDVVTTQEITEEEQAAEVAARESRLASPGPRVAEALVQDSGCANADLWLFDQTGFKGNELCFYNANRSTYDSADLGQYIRYCNYTGTFWWCRPWYTNNTSAVASYWAGASPGCFGNQNTPSTWGYFTNFVAWGSASDASTSSVSSNEFVLLDTSCTATPR